MSRPRPLAVATTIGVLLGLALAALSAARPLAHDDLFFHLHTGRLIAETWQVPRVDPFSHTMPGAPWTTHEWGFALLVDRVHGWAGLGGLVALGSMLVLACFALTDRVIRSLVAPERAPLRVVLLVFGVLSVERAMFLVRAALLSSLALAALQYLLHRHHRTRNNALFVPIAALMWCWANVHVGVLFGLCVLGAYCAQGLAEAWAARSTPAAADVAKRAFGARVALGLGCAALTLLNPNGLSLWTFAFELNDLYYNSGVRWSMGMFGPPKPAQYPFFFAMALCVLLALVPLRRRLATEKLSEQPLVMQGLSVLLFMGLSLRSMRFVPDFATYALPWLALAWGRAGVRDDGQSNARRYGLLALAALALMTATLLLKPALPSRLLPPWAPQPVADFMQRERLRGTMFNHENWGGYLGWRLNELVYWDGRNDVFAPLAKEFAKTKDRGQLVARHRLDMLVLDRGYHQRFADYLRAAADRWALVYFDDYAALYLARGKRFDPVIARRAYRLLKPFGVPSEAALKAAARDPRSALMLRREVAQLRSDGASDVGRHLGAALDRLPQTPSASVALPVPQRIQTILAAADRTEADRTLDAGRHPGEMLAFFDVQEGMKVAEIFAGSGYTTELLARAVGKEGRVFAQNNQFVLDRFAAEPLAARLARPINANVVRVDREYEAPLPPEATALDRVFSVLVYHDTFWQGADRDKMNKAIFDALKPGGIYAVIDHSGRVGTASREVKTLHRIEEAVVREEIERAGFVLQAEATFLRNPSDARDWNDAPSAAADRRGTSDRFVLKYVKPAR